MNTPQNNDQETVLAISATPEEVGAMLFEISTSRPEIATFLDAVTPNTAFIFSAWFIGLLGAQQPSMLEDFRKALDVGVQVGTVMYEDYLKNNSDGPKDSIVVIYPQSPSNASQLSLSDSTGFIQ